MNKVQCPKDKLADGPKATRAGVAHHSAGCKIHPQASAIFAALRPMGLVAVAHLYLPLVFFVEKIWFCSTLVLSYTSKWSIYYFKQLFFLLVLS